MKDSPDVVLIVKGDGNLCVLGNGGNSIDTQVDHPISNHMTNLVKQSREKLTSPQVALLISEREDSFSKVALKYYMNNYPKIAKGKSLFHCSVSSYAFPLTSAYPIVLQPDESFNRNISFQEKFTFPTFC